jgi:hypothetical protein
MIPFRKFKRHWKAALRLPAQDRYQKAQLCSKQFLLCRERGLDVYYVPFHHLNIHARIVLVGITPGWTQMERAFWAAKKGQADGLNGERLFSYINSTGSFSGPMRTNLVEMLDGIGISRCLGIGSCSDLFSESNHLVHFTSAISAPIFKGGKNYAGVNPRLLEVPTLKAFVLAHLAEELAAMPRAIIIPLGKVPNVVIRFLKENKLVAADRCLTDFPHPSGANGHRKPMFARGRRRWQVQVRKWLASYRARGFFPKTTLPRTEHLSV